MAKARAADLVVYGTIYTAEDDRIAEAFAVKDAQFVYVGDREGAAAFVDPGSTEVIDYSGKGLIMPSCGNGHGHHPMGFAIHAVGVMVGSDDTPERFLNEILPPAVMKAREAGATSIFGFGWEVTGFKDSMPTRQQLDAICPDIPIHIADSEGPGRRNPRRQGTGDLLRGREGLRPLGLHGAPRNRHLEARSQEGP